MASPARLTAVHWHLRTETAGSIGIDWLGESVAMTMNRRAFLSMLLACFTGLSLPKMLGCERSPSGAPSPVARSATPREAGPLRVVVTIAPLGALVQELAPPDAQVRVLLPPGRSEHGYEPTPEDMAALAHADLVVTVGLGLEPRVDEFIRKNPSDRRAVLSMGEALESQGSEHGSDAPSSHADANRDEHDAVDDHDAQDQDQHQHDESQLGESQHEGHAHGSIDPHVWLDPVLVKSFVPKLAGAIDRAERAAGLMNDGEKSRLASSSDALASKLDALDAEYAMALAPLAGRAIVTHHSAWGRLASRYGLKVAAVLRPIETSESTPGDIAGAVDAVRGRHASAIFIEPQFDHESAKRVADAASVRMLVLDPLGGEDYFATMRANLAALKEGLAPK